MFSADELHRRGPVWEALAELFVGKELQDYDYRAIADALCASGYSSTELKQILQNEVNPVFRSNLSAIAVTEMEGWSRESVEAEIRAYLEKRRTGWREMARLLLSRPVPPLAAQRWDKVRALLSNQA